jgi:hypothetical protein
LAHISALPSTSSKSQLYCWSSSVGAIEGSSVGTGVGVGVGMWVGDSEGKSVGDWVDEGACVGGTEGVAEDAHVASLQTNS